MMENDLKTMLNEECQMGIQIKEKEELMKKVLYDTKKLRKIREELKTLRKNRGQLAAKIRKLANKKENIVIGEDPQEIRKQVEINEEHNKDRKSVV